MEKKMHIEFLIGGSSSIPFVGDFKAGEVKEVPASTGEILIMRCQAKEAGRAAEPEAGKPAPKPVVKKDKKSKSKEDEANG